jgi:hypothetical protein
VDGLDTGRAGSAWWGDTPLIGGESSAIHAGSLPASGTWTRIAIPATQLGLSGKIIQTVSFTTYGGQVWIDGVGRSSSGNALSNDAASHDILHFAGIEDAFVKGPRDANGNRTTEPKPAIRIPTS